MKNKITGIKPKTPKQIALAGLTLNVGMIALPFIPFKKAKDYKPFRRKLKFQPN
jgi:hypothetical protein